MNYEKLTSEKPDKSKYAEKCQITGCNKDADVSFMTYRGVRIVRCARHYMDDVDKAKKGALSAKLNERLAIERENQRVIGGVAYRKQSMNLARQFIKGLK